MANPNPIVIIPPFPADVDRDSFGNWLSGFVDGEGHFGLLDDKRNYPAARFSINLRADDLPILQQIQSYWQVGRILYSEYPSNCRSKPKVNYQVNKARDLAEILIPHFEHYPLRAKKSRDFQIWKTGILIIKKSVCRRRQYGPGRKGYRPKLSDQERSEFSSLVKSIKEIRRFDSTDHGFLDTDNHNENSLVFGQLSLFDESDDL